MKSFSSHWSSWCLIYDLFFCNYLRTEENKLWGWQKVSEFLATHCLLNNSCAWSVWFDLQKKKRKKRRKKQVSSIILKSYNIDKKANYGSWKFKAFNNLVPVESRPCNKGEQMTHWESHADFLKVYFHQNCSLPVVSQWPAMEIHNIETYVKDLKY